MKKILIGCILVITLGISKDYTQADRILDMQKMAHAMKDIQSGFFYNNVDIVKAGVEDLKKAVTKIHETKEERLNKDVYEKWITHNIAMTKRIQRFISSRADTLLERFSTGDAVEALQVYTKITGECMKCHIRLRKW